MTIKDDIDNLRTEAKILAETIEIETNSFSESMKQHKSTIEQELYKLKEYNVMLQAVPKKLDSQIQELFPKIAMELDNINNQKMDDVKKYYVNQTEVYITSLIEAQQKIDQLTENIKKVNRRRILNFFLGVIISSGIAVGGATYAASYMMQTFPTRVVINTPENIILYDSDVSLWGTDNVKVLQGLRKNDKKNPRKF